MLATPLSTTQGSATVTVIDLDTKTLSRPCLKTMTLELELAGVRP
jgi:hypothetical protein